MQQIDTTPGGGAFSPGEGRDRISLRTMPRQENEDPKSTFSTDNSGGTMPTRTNPHAGNGKNRALWQ